MDRSISKIVVLGASGYIGHNFTDLVRSKKEYQLYAYSSAECDLTNLNSIRAHALIWDSQTSLVIFSGVRPSKSTGSIYFHNNPEMIQNLIGAFSNGVPGQLIFISSTAVYGSGDGTPLNESSLIKPDNEYGKSKADCEVLIENWCKDNPARVAVLRPSIVYGKDTYSRTLIGRWKESILSKGTLKIEGNGKGRRDFVYCNDVCDSIYNAIAAQSSGIYNLVSGESVSISDAANELIHMLGRPTDISVDKDDHTYNYSVSFDNSKMIELLGKAPIQFSDGIKDYR